MIRVGGYFSLTDINVIVWFDVKGSPGVLSGNGLKFSNDINNITIFIKVK